MNTPVIAKIERVMVDLDTVLDTRLGCLAKHNDELAVQAVTDKNYHTRQQDSFPGISYEQFRDLYKNRDREVLQCSVVTNVFTLIHDIVETHLKVCRERSDLPNMEIVLNTYPYDLTNDEKEDFAELIYQRLGGVVSVKVERYPDGFLTPQWCRENLTVMVRYSLEEWVESQMKNLEAQQMPQVTVFAPALYCKLPNKEDLDEFKRMNTHPFHANEVAFAPLMGLRLLDVKIFSIHSPS